MFYSLKLFFQDRVVAATAAVGLLIQLYLWWFLGTGVTSSADQIFLHYNVIFGVDLVGKWWKIFYLPLTGFFILAVNLAFGFIIFAKDKMAARLLMIAAAVLEALLIIGASVVANLNF